MRVWMQSLTCFVLPVMMLCSGSAVASQAAVSETRPQPALAMPLPSIAEREELAQQLLELALADVHPKFNQLWLQLVSGQHGQDAQWYADLYGVMAQFRRQWHGIDWQRRERLELTGLDLTVNPDDLARYQRALQAGQLTPLLDESQPQVANYQAMRTNLLRLLDMARQGAWPVTAGKTLHPDEADTLVPQLKYLLARTGDLPSADQDILYDAATVEAVKAFQRRHGLAVDGVVGNHTWFWLNVKPQERAVILARTLLRRDMGPLSYPRYILVNLPEYRLRLLQDGQPLMTSRVIVGQVKRQTPILSSQIASVVVNPAWHVPRSILKKDIVPKLARDPSYLEKEQFDVIDYEGAQVPPDSIPWEHALAAGFPYQLRQRPGDHNALGRYKFYLPNNDDIYLHSTSSPRLFNKDSRAISSGCVRVEQAAELAHLLLQGSAWTDERLGNLLEETTTKWLPLRNPVPVFTVYWRSWLDDQGQLQFRDDIYGFDAGSRMGDSQVMASLLAVQKS
ncbi:L,D-transpeptidase family protein [Pseudaeromonas paramecii]|uniref:L,D-transpeptidase family protein n=1 Tax=Pseudaeromonas paramecii TaxID=2138166 RepID=A0ABP8QEC7_9GAMM